MMLHETRGSRCLSCAQNISSSCYLSRVPCRLIRTARLLCCSLHCPHPLHLHFPALAQRRFNQEPAPIHTALEVTVLRNPILSHFPMLSQTLFSQNTGVCCVQETNAGDLSSFLDQPYSNDGPSGSRGLEAAFLLGLQRIFHSSLLKKEHAERLLPESTTFDVDTYTSVRVGTRKGHERMGLRRKT